jgi:hypothetical protein
MRHRHYLAVLLSLLVSSSAGAQVVEGVMTVTGAEMH